MGLKFLNKKGWHTGSLRNIENVWKAEQKHAAEDKKLDELRKQIVEERERSEFRQLQKNLPLSNCNFLLSVNSNLNFNPWVKFSVFAAVVLEEGYTVTTVIDGHKLGINPYSVLPRPGSSDLLVLDSSGSAFYTVSLPVSKSQDSVIKHLSGDGGEGYSDGESASARFKKPRGFAVNQKGTVFVADRSNNVIRKISASGVSTIAGGYSLKPGHEDGPAQNATFSADFDLAFDPDKCALMVSDRGNQLVRLISLKPEDCARSSPPSGLDSVPLWILTLALSCFAGILVGLVIRPYIIPYTGGQQPVRLQRDMEAMPNQSDEASTDSLLRHQKRSC